MKGILRDLLEYKTLDKFQARQVLNEIAYGNHNHSSIAAFVTVYMMRSITVDELEGFRQALLELCDRVDLSEFEPMDMCGTGGDGKDTFNISTLASFVTAGAGYKIAKHGNYGVSSSCGSSDVMQQLGLIFTSEKDLLKKQIDKAGICFLHAPLFHPAMKQVAPVRKELGLKTFFNMLGPLVNPAFPKFQYTGVFSLELARLYNYVLQQEDSTFTVVHSIDGYDEVSLTGDFKMYDNHGEFLYSPEEIGSKRLNAEEIRGDKDVESAATGFVKVLKNQGTDQQNEVVCANAALAIRCRTGKPLAECRAEAVESLASGRALKAFNTLLEIKN